MLPQTAVHWLSSAEVGAKFGVEQMSHFLGDFTRQTKIIYIEFNRASIIFSARSGAFWQEVQALKKYCFRFQPSSITCHIVR